MKKGHFHPPIGRDAVLDNYINCLQKYPLEDNIRNYRGNLNANEKQALDTLKAGLCRGPTARFFKNRELRRNSGSRD